MPAGQSRQPRGAHHVRLGQPFTTHHLAEIAGWLPEGERRTRYLARAGAILDSLASSYAPADGTSNALLLHGVYNKPEGHGIDEGTLWGDYFYLEALTRAARPDWALYW